MTTEPNFTLEEMDEIIGFQDTEVCRLQNNGFGHRRAAKVLAALLDYKRLRTTDSASADLAAATAHRVCHSTEHDAAKGRLHGYCIVCGIPWPCETASFFMRRVQP